MSKVIAILTVIPTEFQAGLQALKIPNNDRNRANNGTIFFHGQLRSNLRSITYEVFVGCIGHAGNYDAATVTANFIGTLKPDMMILMGIAAGMKNKVKIGDVILSERVVAYESAAIDTGPTGEAVEQPRPDIHRLPYTVVQNVSAYLAYMEADRLHKRFINLGWDIPRPPRGRKRDYNSFVASTITARQETIASGEKLLRHPTVLYQVQNIHNKTKVGEMEAAGFVTACNHQNPPIPWLVIRGISDFGDNFKDDRFHPFAARAAAVVLADFLRNGLDFGGPPATPSIDDDQISLGSALSALDQLQQRLQERPWYSDEKEQAIATFDRALDITNTIITQVLNSTNSINPSAFGTFRSESYSIQDLAHTIRMILQNMPTKGQNRSHLSASEEDLQQHLREMYQKVKALHQMTETRSGGGSR